MNGGTIVFVVVAALAGAIVTYLWLSQGATTANSTGY
jgi:hypothetical protein